MERVEPLTVTVSEAAVALGISRTTAYECVRTGELRAVRLGRRLVVPRDAITELLAGASAAPVPRDLAPSTGTHELSDRPHAGA